MERSELVEFGIVIFRNGASGCWNTVTELLSLFLVPEPFSLFLVPELFSWFLVPELRLVLLFLAPGSWILGGSGIGFSEFLVYASESIGIKMDFLDFMDEMDRLDLFSTERDELDELD